MITFYCSNCGTKISAEPEYAGASANCPTCAHDLVVPTTLGDATVEQQNPAVGIRDLSPDVATSGESYGENETSREDAEHSLGDRLKTGAKDGWSSIKSQSKQAALRTQIEKLKNVELRMAHHSLGKKCFETGIFDLQFSEQFQAIRNLDATIAEKRSDEEVEDDETKVAALKRMGIHAVKESQAQALLLKRRVLLAELGKSAFLIGGSADLSGIGPERAVIETIETRIRSKEAETLEIQKAGEGKSRVPMITIVALLIIVVSAGAIMGLKSLAGGGDSLRSGKYDAEAAFGQEATRLQGVMRDNDGKPCRVCDGAGYRGQTGCPDCKVGFGDDFSGQGTVTTPSGYVMACSRCKGSGLVPATCSACGGTGVFRSPY